MMTEPKDAATGLMQAVRSKFANGCSFEEIKSRSWSSATFRGASHEIVFRLDGEGAEEAATTFSMNLSGAYLDFPGHLVADVDVVSKEMRPDFARISLDALTVEEK